MVMHEIKWNYMPVRVKYHVEIQYTRVTILKLRGKYSYRRNVTKNTHIHITMISRYALLSNHIQCQL